MGLEGLFNKVTFISTEVFRKQRNELYECLEKESPGRGNSKYKSPVVGMCLLHLKGSREAHVVEAV